MVLLFLAVASIVTVRAETLTDDLNGIFTEVLDVKLAGPGAHGDHFKPSNVATSATVISAITALIGTNASSYPLSSTSAGLTFDLSSGVPVASQTSSGPIFGERASTLGKGKLNFGFNYSILNLSTIRGLKTKDIRFTFFHQDLDAPGMGDNINEYDVIYLDMHLDINASVIATYATYGISDRMDVGIAIPLVNVSIKSDPFAQMNSFTYASTGSANHFFAGTPTDPVLTLTPTPVDASSFGIGDVILRTKYNFYQGKKHDLAGLAELKLATGDEDNFRGTGKSSFKLLFIASAKGNAFSPHINTGFNFKAGDLFRDEFLLTTGYDQKLSDRITFAVEWIGQFQMGSQPGALKFPAPITIGPTISSGQIVARTENATNIPSFSSDNVTNASFGIKYSTSPKMLLTGNIILPTNKGGLRSDVIATVGLEFTM